MMVQTKARKTKMRIHHVVLSCATTALVATYAGSIPSSHAFSPQITTKQIITTQINRSTGRAMLNKSSLIGLYAQRSGQKKTTGSQYGVRRRVRSVLERAKNRTGIRNSSEYLDKENLKIDGTGVENNSLNSSDPEVSRLRSLIPDSSQRKMRSNKKKRDDFQAQRKSRTLSTRKSSIQTVSSVSSVVADVAAIGGFGDDEVVLELTKKDTGNATSASIPRKITSPASTYSPTIKPKPALGDSLLDPKEGIPEIDALKGDVSAAFSMPPPPLPFTLPSLTPDQQKKLDLGERVQYQSDMSREGSGFVVLDVKAPAAVVWECLLDFYSYPQTIPTVRDVQMFTNTHLAEDYFAEEAIERIEYQDGTLATLKHGIPSVTRASFSLSKLRLSIAAIHKYRPHPLGDYMVFTLDPACTNVVLQSAKGVWYTQSNPDGMGEEYTRVWLLCELKVSPLLPQWITDYAAKRAMPRATSWLKPTVETAAELWYKGLKD